MQQKKKKEKEIINPTQNLYLYSNDTQEQESFKNFVNSTQITRESFIKKIQTMKDLSKLQKNAQELENTYNTLLKKVNVDDKGIRQKIIENINKHLEKFNARVRPENILQAMSSLGEDPSTTLASYLTKDMKKLKYFDVNQKRISQTNVKEILANMMKRLNNILANAELTSDLMIQAKQIKKEVKALQKKIKNNQISSTQDYFHTLMTSDQGISIPQLNSLIRAVDSCENAIALANGDIGEILAHMLTYIAAADAKDIGNELIDEAFGKAIASMKEFGASYNNIVGVHKTTGQVYTGAEILNLGNNNDIKLFRHRGKTDVQINYRFKNEPEDTTFNLSVKNYKSFSDLTIVDGTPLDTIIRYISNSTQKNLLLNSMMSFKNDNESIISKKRALAKQALKAKIFQNALQGYGETIINKQNKGFVDIFVVFNNTQQQVKCISVPYAVNTFLAAENEKSANVSIKVNNEDLSDGLTVMNAPDRKISSEQQQKAKINSLYNQLNNYKIHVSLTKLDSFLRTQAKKKS